MVNVNNAGNICCNGISQSVFFSGLGFYCIFQSPDFCCLFIQRRTPEWFNSWLMCLSLSVELFHWVKIQKVLIPKSGFLRF